ncbi:CGNR zinc finger domain-containing protein [Hoyosella subflava]|uniref:CGNR zinc finger domain-containing protein n=1 Tax=Hoyosella subflava TaxID=639313 RepID=UPI003899400D
MRLLQRFVNTRSLMRNVDHLASSRSFAEWLDELGYGLANAPLEPEELERLLRLRETLRTILVAHTRGTAPQMESAIAELNRILDRVPLHVSFSSAGQPQLAPRSATLKGFEERLVAGAVWAVHAGIWERLKVCANKDCGWAFYDRSKNRSGSWCDMDMCGSRAKMRSYRQRQSSSAAQIHGHVGDN